MNYLSSSLRAHLLYEPKELKFGTSGRRGEVIHLTQLEVYINALAELEYLQSLGSALGGIKSGDPFYFACDLRPSSTRMVPEQAGKGEIAQAIVRAIQDAGMQPVNLGFIPTPALTCFALAKHCGSIMVTGSHIPFDRNGYKTNSAKGELLKQDEAPIDRRVAEVRDRIYSEPFAASRFDPTGLFKNGHQELPPPIEDARQAYIQRYVDFFGSGSLAGIQLLVYQHSSVGRDLVVDILRQLGACVVPTGRSDTFIPIDTENIDAEQLAVFQRLTLEAWLEQGPFDAVVSTDGDSDRPLVLGVERKKSVTQPCQVRFFSGDLVGMIVAEYLGADAVVVPISCNDAIDRGPLKRVLEPKTRIGSPQVIAGMEKALAKGRQAVCGWEANGGFLTGSDFVKNGRKLTALPTRDALLPILGVLNAMKASPANLIELFARLPQRFSQAALLRNFPRAVGTRIVERFSPPDIQVKDALFRSTGSTFLDENESEIAVRWNVDDVRTALEGFFRPEDEFGKIERLNYTDGLRIYFSNGDVAHVRPSGNADEMRIYAVADHPARAEQIARLGIAEPQGILRQMEKAVRDA